MIRKVIPKMPVTPLGKMQVASKEVKPMPMTPSMKKPIVPLDKQLMGGASKPRVVTPLTGGANRPTPNKSFVSDKPTPIIPKQDMTRSIMPVEPKRVLPVGPKPIPTKPKMSLMDQQKDYQKRKSSIDETFNVNRKSESIMPVERTLSSVANDFMKTKKKY